jgi:transposase
MDNCQLSFSQLTVLRRKVVEAVIDQDYKNKEVCRMLKISANSISKYIQSYRQRRFDGLIYKARGIPVYNKLKEVIESRMFDTLG